MKQNNLTIMLGLSFYKNTDQVLETLASFVSTMAVMPCKLILGFENELPKEKIPGTRRGASLSDELQKQGWGASYLWDDELNRIGTTALQTTTGRPFYGNFSYGAAVNRLVLLAGIAGAAVLVRIDPGTGAGSNFDKLLRSHLDIILRNPGCIVSAQYSRRQAIRDEFVASVNVVRYYDLIRRYTGINAAAGCQLTGGAAFTMTTDSPPAIPFDGVKVWGSDDGFYQVMYPGTTIVQNEYVVERSESGFDLQVTDYIGRVANMVVYKAIYDGESVDDGFRKAALFMDEMEDVVDPKHCFDKRCCADSLRKILPLIAQGHVNYKALKRSWGDIQQTVKERVPAGVARMFGENL